MEQYEPARKRLAVPREVLALAIAIAVPILVYRSVGPESHAAFGGNYEHMAIARTSTRTSRLKVMAMGSRVSWAVTVYRPREMTRPGR